MFRRADGARAGKVFYVKFWDAEAQDYVGRRSVGALLGEVRSALPAGTSPITKAGARRIVEAWLEDHSPAPARGQAVTLQAYLSAFWDDAGQYATSLRARGRTISKEYLYNSRKLIANHVLPWLASTAPGLALRDVTAGHLEALIMHCREKNAIKGDRAGQKVDTGKLLTARTVNSIRQAVAVPLAEAYRLGLIRENPAGRAPKLAETTASRGVLTLAEARAVIAAPWADPRARAASLLAATTGMRLGEVRGLTLEAIHKDEIEIRNSWADKEGLKSPKWGSARTVPVPAHVEALLRKQAEGNPWGDGLVFYGAHRGRPYGEVEIRKGLQTALEAVGIDPSRGVTFHSWRHFFNSQMRDRIPDHALRQLTGHRSEAMTERYTHMTEEMKGAAALLIEKILLTK